MLTTICGIVCHDILPICKEPVTVGRYVNNDMQLE